MSTVEFAASWTGARHRAKGFDWNRITSAVSLALLALGVYGGWAWVVGPFLIDLIGLWPTRAVGAALIALIVWRR